MAVSQTLFPKITPDGDQAPDRQTKDIHFPKDQTPREACCFVYQQIRGDWVENLSALEYHQGEWKIKGQLHQKVNEQIVVDHLFEVIPILGMKGGNQWHVELYSKFCSNLSTDERTMGMQQVKLDLFNLLFELDIE